jgi:hypothetical protein
MKITLGVARCRRRPGRFHCERSVLRCDHPAGRVRGAGFVRRLRCRDVQGWVTSGECGNWVCTRYPSRTRRSPDLTGPSWWCGKPLHESGAMCSHAPAPSARPDLVARAVRHALCMH